MKSGRDWAVEKKWDSSVVAESWDEELAHTAGEVRREGEGTYKLVADDISHRGRLVDVFGADVVRLQQRHLIR